MNERSRPSVLIVGAHSDIGRALARVYASAGRDLFLAARRPERLDRDAADLRLRQGVAVTVTAFDILDIAAHAALLEGISPLPETVISVVGFMGQQEESERQPAAAQLVLRSNFEAPSLLLGSVADLMAARGSGTIIGISSVAGERGRATNYVYGSAKAGFTSFLSGLRNRLAKRGVRVITAKPGFVATRMTEGMTLPAGLTAQPEEVAAAVLKAERRRRDVIYVRPVWRLIMLMIRLIPEPIFKKLRL